MINLVRTAFNTRRGTRCASPCNSDRPANRSLTAPKSVHTPLLRYIIASDLLLSFFSPKVHDVLHLHILWSASKLRRTALHDNGELIQ